MNHLKNILNNIENQKISLSKETNLNADDFNLIIFSEDDVVDQYLNDNGLSDDDIDINAARDAQRDALNELVGE